jgi:F1F0 ATPase subunit 2
MDNGDQLLIGCLWGMILGITYFGGLWVTVRLVPRVSNPKILLFASFILRMALLLAGIWIVLRAGPLAFAATLGAILLVRFVMIRTAGRPQKEVMHANQP